MDRLADYEVKDLKADADFQEAKEEKNEAWKIDNNQKADWALRKIAALKEQNQEVEQMALREYERIDKWSKRETESNKASIEFIQQKLTEYLYDLRKKDPKAKIKLPHGMVSTRKVPAKFEYDEKKTINSLKSMGLIDFIKIKESIDKAKLKKSVNVANGKAINADGEIIEGITITEPRETVVFKEEI